MKTQKIKISKNSKPLIVAEVGQSHEGKIKNVFKNIDLISKTGADVVKFQTHYADEESTLDEPFRKKSSIKVKSRIEYWRKMEFSEGDWKKIKKYCEKKNLIFLSSPFSLKAIKVLRKIGMKFWKIGSGEFFSNDMLEALDKLNQTVILSTGLSTYIDINKQLKFFKNKKKIILMQCTSEYPSNLKSIGIENIKKLREKYNVHTGLSDHSGKIGPALMALSLGAKIIEIHFKINENKNNLDKDASLNFNQLKLLCELRDEIHILQTNKVNKNILSKEQKKNKRIFTKSASLFKEKKKNEILRKKDILFKKPGYGIKYNELNLIIGKKFKINKKSNKLLKWSDLS